jgi:hypothetical protein
MRNAVPDAVAVAHCPHRRVHLDQRAQPRIIIRAQRQVMRRRLAGRDILVLFEEGDLLGGRDVQHVDAGANLARDAHQALGAAQCRDLVTPYRVRGRIALDAFAEPLAQPELVLGMESGATARVPQNRGDALVFLDQQIAGGRAHEHFYPGRARQPLKIACVFRILAGAADPEGKVAMHAAGGALNLVGKGCFAGGQRVGVGHFENGGDAAQHRCPRTCLQILLMLEPRLAEMHLAVDDPRKDVQPATVDRFGGGCLAEIADDGDAPAIDAYVATALTIVVDHRAACQDEVVGRGHADPVSCGGSVSGLRNGRPFCKIRFLFRPCPLPSCPCPLLS